MKDTKRNVHKYANCPLCRSDKTTLTESISLAKVGALWVQHFPGMAPLVRKLPAKTIRMLVCRRCQLEWAVPAFEGGAAWYKQVCAYPTMRWEYDVAIKRIKRESLLIELGCGPGHFLKRARHFGLNAVGFDFNRASIKEARANGLQAFFGGISEALELNAKTPCASIVLVAFHVVEHLSEISQFGSELSRLAQSVHLSFPNPNRWTRNLLPSWRAGKHEMWDYPPWHQSRWNRDSIAAFADCFGFELVTYSEEPLNMREVATTVAQEEPQLTLHEMKYDLSLEAASRNQLGGRSAHVELRSSSSN